MLYFKTTHGNLFLVLPTQILFLANGFFAKSFTPMGASHDIKPGGFVVAFLNNKELITMKHFLLLLNLAPFVLFLVLLSPLPGLFTNLMLKMLSSMVPFKKLSTVSNLWVLKIHPFQLMSVFFRNLSTVLNRPQELGFNASPPSSKQ